MFFYLHNLGGGVYINGEESEERSRVLTISKYELVSVLNV
jgi:hypothetical protein